MKTYQTDWQDIKDIWSSSAQTKHINIEVNTLIDSLKEKVSPWEEELVKKDLAVLNLHWKKYKSAVSTFEKQSIEKDLSLFSSKIKKVLAWFKK